MSGFGAILLDPPWPFRNYSGNDVVPTQGAQPYPPMSIDEIAALNIDGIAADDCLLFLWQNDSLPLAPAQLAQRWKFEIVTDNVFIWVKPSIGMGYYTRKEAETVALLKRGRPKVLSHGVRQVIMEPRREHSRKPDEIYSRIEQLVAGPYVELFARQRWPGWYAWGNEVDKFRSAAE